MKKRQLFGSLNIINFHQVAEKFDSRFHTKGTFTEFKQFQKLILKINDKYGIVSLSKGVELLKSRSINDNPIFAITFDDGDISLERKVIPFLQSKEIPATEFINTKYLDHQSASWVSMYTFLKSINHYVFEKNDNLLYAFIQIRNTNNRKIYHNYCAILEKAFVQLDKKPSITVDLEWLGTLNKKLFHIGLHGHNHHRYSMLSYNEQKEDIEQNISILEQFENYIPYWALPFGTSIDWNRNTIKIALEKDLLLFFHTNSNNRSWNDIGLDRIPSDGKTLYDIIKGF
ncbi:MAG TPA: polysaccharide deacetylase family protein [Bacteroidales bacterium]|nr:polysaccharide deacetylase family protein [Bacteroidales bacterium]